MAISRVRSAGISSLFRRSAGHRIPAPLVLAWALLGLPAACTSYHALPRDGGPDQSSGGGGTGTGGRANSDAAAPDLTAGAGGRAADAAVGIGGTVGGTGGTVGGSGGMVGGSGGMVAGTGGRVDAGTDVAPPQCSTDANCAACQTCSGGRCVAVMNQDDPVAARCAGTCDATGACRSKRGQTCQTTAGGCVSGTSCAPDGYCCDRACGNSCEACDIAGFLGTCTPVASGAPHGNRTSCGTGTCAGACGGRTDGQCAFPTVPCGPATSCSGQQVVGQGSCSAGACVPPSAQACPNALVCSGSACLTSCAGDADCIANDFCGAATCHVDAIKIETGGYHSFAILRDGTLRGWGQNDAGQLGEGSKSPSTVPIPVSGLGGVTAVAGWFGHSCALLSGGGVRCWGANFSGQLGNNTMTEALQPVTASGITTATAIAVGNGFSCALLGNGTVSCWGSVGLISSMVPVAVAGVTGATRIAAGSAHACAVVAGGAVNCWGIRFDGELGDGIASLTTSGPVAVSNLTGATAISAGGQHTCAVLSDQTVRCWGGNSLLQLGNEFVGMLSSVPVVVTGLSGVTALDAGGYHTCALLTTGGVRCWGNGVEGELGNGNSGAAATTLTPVTPTGLNAGVTAIAGGNTHTCALLTSGAMRCWGENGGGRLGNGLTTLSATPVVVTGW